MPQQRSEELRFPWYACTCACGKRVAVAARDGWSWIPDPEDDMPPHPDVVACGYCHLRCLRDGALTLSEQRYKIVTLLEKRGNNRTYLLARIERDCPDIFLRFCAGEFLSVRAAAKAAGIVRVPRKKDKKEPAHA